jgi:hypothetical protein
MLKITEPVDDRVDFSQIDPIVLGRELCGLTHRDNLTDDEYAQIAREWLDAFGVRNAVPLVPD